MLENSNRAIGFGVVIAPYCRRADVEENLY